MNPIPTRIRMAEVILLARYGDPRDVDAVLAAARQFGDCHTVQHAFEDFENRVTIFEPVGFVRNPMTSSISCNTCTTGSGVSRGSSVPDRQVGFVSWSIIPVISTRSAA
jgi:hypothetical protein